MGQQHLLLKEWFEDNSQSLRAHGITLGLEESSVPGSEAICVDIDSDAAIARITIRATAQCDVEVLDVQTGGRIYSCYIEKVDHEGLHAVMHEVLKRMSRS